MNSYPIRGDYKSLQSNNQITSSPKDLQHRPGKRTWIYSKCQEQITRRNYVRKGKSNTPALILAARATVWIAAKYSTLRNSSQVAQGHVTGQIRNLK